MFWIVLAGFVVWFGYVLRGIFTPILIAFALAYLFHPLITYVERRWSMPRAVTVGLILAAVVLIGGPILAWGGTLAVRQSIELFNHAEAHVDTLAGRVQRRLEVDVSPFADQLKQHIASLKQNPGPTLVAAIKSAFAGEGRVAGVLENILGATAYVMLSLALIPIYFYYFAWQFGPLTHGYSRYIPASQRDETLQVIRQMDRAVSSFFRGRLIICLIMGVLFSVGWAMVGVPYAILLGLAAGAMSLVPFLSAVIWPLAVILMYVDQSSAAAASEAAGSLDAADANLVAAAMWPTIVYIIVQIIEGWALTPFIQGKSLEMSPVLILVVVVIGGAVGGLYGLLLCIPAAACLRILVREVAEPRLRQWAAEN